MRTIEWADIEQSLSEVDFPASKQRLVAHAEQGGGTEETIRALRAVPLAIYESLAEVRDSIQLAR